MKDETVTAFDVLYGCKTLSPRLVSRLLPGEPRRQWFAIVQPNGDVSWEATLAVVLDAATSE